MTKNKNTSPNHMLALGSGLALALGLGVILINPLLGISMTFCFGTFLAYALTSNRRQADDAGQPSTTAQ